MIDLDRNEMAVLARARRALSPTTADEQRVARAVNATVVAAAGHATAVASRLLTTCAVAAIAAGSGYWVGHRAGLRDGQTGAAALSSAALMAAPRATPTATPPLVDVIASAPTPASASSSSASRALAGSAPHARPGHNTPALAPAPATSPADSLNQELRVLRSVERALRNRQPGLALALLRDLDRAIPQGKLMEERAATSTIARCASGDGPIGLNLGDEFADRFPNSVYFERVEQACR